LPRRLSFLYKTAFQDIWLNITTSLPLLRSAICFSWLLFSPIVRAKMAASEKLLEAPNCPMQIGRGLLLAGQICVAILSFSTVGLVNFHAVFASYPLMVMALSLPVLGEAVGWRRWLAVCIGFCGVLLILRPGTEMFGSASILPVLAAFMMAVYGILTRYAARRDAALTNFFLDSDCGRYRYAGNRAIFLVTARWH